MHTIRKLPALLLFSVTTAWSALRWYRLPFPTSDWLDQPLHLVKWQDLSHVCWVLPGILGFLSTAGCRAVKARLCFTIGYWAAKLPSFRQAWCLCMAPDSCSPTTWLCLPVHGKWHIDPFYLPSHPYHVLISEAHFTFSMAVSPKIVQKCLPLQSNRNKGRKKRIRQHPLVDCPQIRWRELDDLKPGL